MANFTDNFNRADGALSNGWTAVSGGFFSAPSSGTGISSNQMRIVGSGVDAGYTQADNLANVDVSVKLVSISGNALLFARFASSTNYYFALLGGVGLNRIYKVISGSSTLLGTVSGSFAAQANDVFRFSLYGSTLKLFCTRSGTETELLSVTDSAITAAGKYGFGTDYGDITIDDFSAVDLALQITTASPLPNATVGTAYSTTIATSGGAGTLSFAITDAGGTGATINSTTGVLSMPAQSTAGDKTITVSATRGSETVSKTFTITVGALPMGFDGTGLELLAVPNEQSPVNNSNATSLNDLTANARHLTATSSYPTFQTGVQNGKAVVRFSGSNNSLKNSASFKVCCGWMVVKHTGATFNTFEGILTGLNNVGILAGNGNGTTTLFNFLDEYYEYRVNDRIYPKESAPAPMGFFKLVFFRFWRPITLDGVQLGQDRADASRKFTGDIGLLALSSRNFCESEIRAQSQRIADYFALTLADVYPYQTDLDGISESPRQEVNFYDPPEGDRISEVLGNPKRILRLKFSGADKTERREMIKFHANHFAPALSCIFRNYAITPPEDIEGYINSPYDIDGSNNDFNYSFEFKEK